MEAPPCLGQRAASGDVVWDSQVHGGKPRREHAGMGLGEQDRDGPTGVGEVVALGVRTALDEALSSEATEVVGGLSRGVVGVEQAGDPPVSWALVNPAIRWLKPARADSSAMTRGSPKRSPGL